MEYKGVTMGNIVESLTHYINGIEVHGAIEWNQIGESIDMENYCGTSMVYGVDAAGVEYSAVGYIDYGVIDDIIESTLKIL